MGDILFLIAMIVCLVGPFVYFQLWWWTVTMSVIVLVVLIAEGLSVLHSGKTLSQKFWKWSKANRLKGWITIGLLSLGWAMLMVHLSWKMLTE